MDMKKILITYMFLVTLVISAQTPEDALLLSLNRNFATARVSGVGGAFGALGGDMGGIPINPAGVGVFRKGSFAGALGLDGTLNASDFIGQSANGFRINLPITSLGIVISDDYTKTSKGKNGKGLQYLNFGITLNRLNHNQERVKLDAFNNQNSYLDRFLQDALSVRTVPALRQNFPFDAALAYETFLLDTIANQFVSAVPNGQVRQQHEVIRRGSTQEIGASLGANIGNKFFVGGSINLYTTRLRQRTSHTERDELGSIFDFKSFSFNQNLNLEGTGFNFKLGFIYQPVSWLRLGGSIQTPTWLTIDDEYDTEMRSAFDNGDSYVVPSAIFASQTYGLHTPGRYTLSAAIMVKQNGFISFDYEALNYQSIRYKFVDNPSRAQLINQNINQQFASAQAFRVGGEYRLGAYALRAGGAFWTSPFSERFKVDNLNLQQTDISLGFGIQKEKVAFDFSYTFSQAPNLYTPYTLESGAFDAALNRVRHIILATVRIPLYN